VPIHDSDGGAWTQAGAGAAKDSAVAAHSHSVAAKIDQVDVVDQSAAAAAESEGESEEESASSEDEGDLDAMLGEEVAGMSIREEEEEEEEEAEPVPEFSYADEAFPSLGAASAPEGAAAPPAGSWGKKVSWPAAEGGSRAAVAAAAPNVVLVSLDNVPTDHFGRRIAPGGLVQPADAAVAAPGEGGAVAPAREVSNTSRIMRSTGAAEYASSATNVFNAEEDDGENWISPSTITASRVSGQGMLGGGRSCGVTNAKVVSRAKVACVTTDFSMENVVLQMGMKLLSVEGRLIHRVKQWVLRCAACHTIHYDVERLFCSKCGVNMLQRIAASTDSKTGELKLHLKVGYKTNTRGMVHSLPKAGTQGRYDGELLLREDQLLTGIWRQKVAKIKHDVKSAFGEDVTGDVGVHINKREFGLKVGLGRRNPNADKGRERRGKKKTKK
jgi:rRNA maturation endonuclease Nob1